MNDFDSLLPVVIAQAKAAGIPVAASIDRHVTVNTRAKKRYGCCIKKGFRYRIELSHLLLEVEEKLCLQTLAHEVLHTCYGCRNHQKRWKSYAARMNEAYGYDIKTTQNPEALGITRDETKREAKYLITCERCGAVIERERASKLVKYPRRYRCRCGGTLSVFVKK